MVQSNFRNVYFNNYFLSDLLFQSIFIFTFIWVSGNLKKIVLIFVVGILTILKNLGTFYLFYLFANKNYGDLNITDFIRIPYFAAYFIYGILYVIGLIGTVKFFGVRFWSLLIYSISLNYTAILMWILIGLIDSGYTFNYSWNSLLLTPVIQSALLATSFYFGLLWHFKTSGLYKYNRNFDDMLDSDL